MTQVLCLVFVLEKLTADSGHLPGLAHKLLPCGRLLPSPLAWTAGENSPSTSLVGHLPRFTCLPSGSA